MRLRRPTRFINTDGSFESFPWGSRNNVPELNISKGGYRYGALPSTFKATDYSRPHFFLNTPPPPFDYTNFEKHQRPVKDQKNQGSCTGQGWSTHQEFLEK